MKSRRILPVVLAAAAILTATHGTAAATAASPAVLWRDNFAGPVGARPNPDRWQVDEGHSEYGDLETYRDTPATIGLTGHGQMRITALRDECRSVTGCGTTSWFRSGRAMRSDPPR